MSVTSFAQAARSTVHRSSEATGGSSARLDILGLCNALVDILVQVDEADIRSLGLTKGIMHLVDGPRQQFVLKHLGTRARTEELGGSVLNAVRALAGLGRRTGFVGMVSDDDFGKRIKNRMQTLGIEAHLSNHPSESTGSCVILITPDGERTMNTSLGASRLYSETSVPHAVIARARMVHFSGYQWDTEGQKNAINSALASARKAGALVSFDVSDPFVIERHRDDFLTIIDRDADVVFANREEARLLYGSTAEDAGRKIAATGAIGVIKLGADGALVCRDKEEIRIPPVPTKLVDTTAAGDMFAAGFLHGLIGDRPLDVCGRMAASLASDVISRVGATLSPAAIERVAKM